MKQKLKYIRRQGITTINIRKNEQNTTKRKKYIAKKSSFTWLIENYSKKI